MFEIHKTKDSSYRVKTPGGALFLSRMRTRACQAISGGFAVAPASLRPSKAAYIGKADNPPSADGGILVEGSHHRLFVGPAYSPRKYRDHQNSLLAGELPRERVRQIWSFSLKKTAKINRQNSGP